MGLGADLDGFGKSRPHRYSIRDRQAYSESLYRLSYPDPPVAVLWNIVRYVFLFCYVTLCTLYRSDRPVSRVSQRGTLPKMPGVN